MIRIAGLAALCCSLFLFVSFSAARLSQSQTTKGSSEDTLSSAEQDLLNEINQARAHPDVYASYLEKLKPLFHEKEYAPSGQEGFKTEEGWSAVEDAISFLRAAKPQGPLSPSNGLRLAAMAHCTDQGNSGATGHSGGGGFIEERVKPFGTWQGGIGENLTYGDESARDRVLLWLIDDGFATRGHRKRLLSADYRVAGVACAVHPEFRKICVLDLAGGFIDSAAVKAATTAQTKPSDVANNKTNTTKRSTKTGKSKTTSKPR
jgi:uncharacterized protein YkwD